MIDLWKILKGEIEEPTKYKPSYENEFGVSVGERLEDEELKSLDERIKEADKREIIRPSPPIEIESFKGELLKPFGIAAIVLLFLFFYFTGFETFAFVFLIFLIFVFRKKKKKFKLK